MAISNRDTRMHGFEVSSQFWQGGRAQRRLQAAQGELVMTLDADLQDDPHEIPHFLAKIEAGCDVVKRLEASAPRSLAQSRPVAQFQLDGQPPHRRDAPRSQLRHKVLRSEIFDEVRLYGEMHRFVPVLAAGRGYKVGELVINHRARKFGNSKYGVRRFLKGFLDLLTVHFLDRLPPASAAHARR